MIQAGNLAPERIDQIYPGWPFENPSWHPFFFLGWPPNWPPLVDFSLIEMCVVGRFE